MSILLGAAKLINTPSVLTGMSCYKLPVSETRDAVIERAFDAYWELGGSFPTIPLVCWETVDKLLL